jgi:hypothetical protein
VTSLKANGKKDFVMAMELTDMQLATNMLEIGNMTKKKVKVRSVYNNL